MFALRYAYVLALVVWLGGMLTLGALVAPTTFEVLQASDPDKGRTMAGELFGTTLARFHLVAYGAGAVLLLSLAAGAVLGPRPPAFAARCAIVAAMLGITLYSGLVVLAGMDALQAEAGALPSTLSVGDPRRVRFDELHGLATRLMLVTVAGALVLLYWEAREP